MDPIARNRTVLVLAGPTASGKSAVAVHLARMLEGEIISADSRQVYRTISIGTAKPPDAIRREVPHHLVDFVNLPSTYTAGAFARDASEKIEEIFRRNRQPIVAGGSGLYIQALTEGIFEGPEADPELRAELESRYRREGIGSLWVDLVHRDPESAEFVPQTNIPRVIRALEVCLITGEPYSKIRRENMVEPGFDAVLFGLDWNRSVLYERINNRVHAMIEEGLVEEVRRLKAQGADPAWQSLNTVGYKEVFAYLGNRGSFEEMISDIQRHTRNYAKRQLTWFRNKQQLNWIEVDEPLDEEATAEKIVSIFRSNTE